MDSPGFGELTNKLPFSGSLQEMLKMVHNHTLDRYEGYVVMSTNTRGKGRVGYAPNMPALMQVLRGVYETGLEITIYGIFDTQGIMITTYGNPNPTTTSSKDFAPTYFGKPAPVAHFSPSTGSAYFHFQAHMDESQDMSDFKAVKKLSEKLNKE